jgi:hypothetical protein
MDANCEETHWALRLQGVWYVLVPLLVSTCCVDVPRWVGVSVPYPTLLRLILGLSAVYGVDMAVAFLLGRLGDEDHAEVAMPRALETFFYPSRRAFRAGRWYRVRAQGAQGRSGSNRQ